MKCSLSVCLIALVIVAGVATNNLGQAPALQKGISVQMAASRTATAMPEADNENAWVVTVAENGDLYFGVNKLSLNGLTEAMRATPRKRAQKLYIKADARTPFANVRKALEAAKDVMFETPVLLTAQPATHAPDVMVPPMGLEVLTDEERSRSDAIVVQVLNSGQPSPTLKIGTQETSGADLTNTLKQLLQNRGEKVVGLSASGALPFSAVASVIDMCHAAGATTAILTPEL